MSIPIILFWYILVAGCNGIISKTEELGITEKADSTANHYKQGFLNGKKGEYSIAIDHYTKVTQVDSNYNSVWYNRAICFERLGDNISAFWDMNRAIENDHTNAEYWAYRGELNIKLSDYVRGKRDLTKAIELDPSKRKYHYLRGFYGIQFNDIIMGEMDFWKALSIPDTSEIKIDSVRVKSLIKELKNKKHGFICYH